MAKALLAKLLRNRAKYLGEIDRRIATSLALEQSAAAELLSAFNHDEPQP